MANQDWRSRSQTTTPPLHTHRDLFASSSSNKKIKASHFGYRVRTQLLNKLVSLSPKTSLRTLRNSKHFCVKKLQFLGNKCLSSQIFNYHVKLQSSTAISFACLLKGSKAAFLFFLSCMAHWYPAPTTHSGGLQFNPQLRRSVCTQPSVSKEYHTAEA